MSDGKPNGALMTGAVGGFLLGGGLALFALGGAAGGSGGGGLGLIGLVLILAGGICHGIGYMALKKLFGGQNGLAGTLAIVFGVAAVLMVLLPLMLGLRDGMQIGFIIFGASVIAYGVVSGLAHLGSAGQSDNGSMLQIGGILNLLGVVGGVWFLLFGVGTLLPQFLTYFTFALAVGAILGGIGMMNQRG